uniref:UPAR/Ly6 domain-containing protein n=1 Tax=Poecilia latipinna TaxID=48699 RepID=A0A3B3V896_9TELE
MNGHAKNKINWTIAKDQNYTLRCNLCFSWYSELCNPTSIQTCPVGQDAYGAVNLTRPVQRSFRQCMNMAVCRGFITTPGVYAICCSTDLCN